MAVVRLVFVRHHEEGIPARDWLRSMGFSEGWYFSTSSRGIERKCSNEFYRRWKPYFTQIARYEHLSRRSGIDNVLTVVVSVKRCTSDHVRECRGIPRLIVFRRDMLNSQFFALAEKSLLIYSNYGRIKPASVLTGKEVKQ